MQKHSPRSRRPFLAAVTFFASLLGASTAAQTEPPAAPSGTGSQSAWSFELPFEIAFDLAGNPNIDYRMLDVSGDGVKDLVVVAEPKKGLFHRDFELFCIDGATGATLWRSVQAGTGMMDEKVWLGPFLALFDGAKNQRVIDLRNNTVRGDLPELGKKKYATPITTFGREWPWGTEALVVDFAAKSAEVLRATYLRLPARPDSPVESFPLEPGCPGLFTATRAILNTAGALVCLDRATGAVLWKSPFEKGAGCAFLGADETHLAVGRRGPNRLSLLTLETGAEVWSAPILGDLSDPSTFFAQPLLTPTHVACYQGKLQGVTVFSRATGQVAWEERATDPYWLVPVGAEAFGLRETHRFRVFRFAAKECVLELRLKKVESLQPDAPRLFLVSRPGDRILALDEETLKVLWEKEAPLARGWITVPSPLEAERMGNRLIGFYGGKAVIMDGRSGTLLGQIPFENWRSLWPLGNYERFLEYTGGTQARCRSLGEGLSSPLSFRESQRLGVFIEPPRLLVREGKVFRMLPAPCALPDEPPQDGLADYTLSFRRLAEYTSTWIP